MFLAILTTLTALTISAVAIYYSIAGLVAIFAAAAVPIMIMGGALEIGKLVTAVWLHRHWKKAAWWLKTYLTVAVVVLMFITSMGIFGFLSKAHIEQTSASEESVAQVQQIDTEIGRLNGIIARADEKIKALETSGTGADANIQSQIDKEQERIDLAFKRIEPAIAQQNKIIEDARGTDAERTKPYEDQLASINAEILRLETSAREYEDKIATLDVDNKSITPLLAQITKIEEEIIRVTNQLNSSEDGQIRAGQAIIGVTSDGLFGGNTRKALAKWVSAQQERISQIQGDISKLRVEANETLEKERVRLAEVVKDIRTVQIPALKERELVMLGKIDDVRKTESPVIQTARDEIQRLRKSAEDQVANSQALIERLRSQLAQTDKADEIDAAVDEQLLKIKVSEAEVDVLTEKKYKLEGEYRMLEAEVGPIKYIAEFIYGETADNTMLEEAVRWVIMIIIFVFDPLAVLLLIASQYTFDFARGRNKDKEWKDYETARGNMIARNSESPKDDAPEPEDKPEPEEEMKFEDVDQETLDKEAEEDAVKVAEEVMEEEKEILEKLEDEPKKKEVESSEELNEEPTDVEQWNKWVQAAEAEVAKEQGIMFGEDNLKSTEIKERANLVAKYEKDAEWNKAKRQWKEDNPDQSIKDWKQAFVSGRIHVLPWAPEQEGYVQNAEQSESSVWNKLQDSKNK